MGQRYYRMAAQDRSRGKRGRNAGQAPRERLPNTLRGQHASCAAAADGVLLWHLRWGAAQAAPGQPARTALRRPAGGGAAWLRRAQPVRRGYDRLRTRAALAAVARQIASSRAYAGGVPEAEGPSRRSI